MRVLVTGATGSLGERVVARLLAEGREVHIVTRRPFLAARLFDDSVRAHEWHPLSEPLPPAALEGVEAIVHLAGEPFSGPADAERLALIRSSRVGLAERLATACRDRARRIVIVSLALPFAGDGGVVTEASPRAAPTTALEQAAVAWEAAGNALAGAGHSVAIVRLGLLAGPGALLATLLRLQRRGFVPNLSGCLIPAIDPEDAAALLTGLASHPEMTGPLFGVAPEPIAGAALSAALAPLRRWPVALPVPARLVSARIGPLAALLLNRVRIVPQRLIDAGAGFRHPEPSASILSALAARGAARVALDEPQAPLPEPSAAT